ncbi:MAG: TetR/AcrR family transcriptional regulator [Pseudomonadota bacterium]
MKRQRGRPKQYDEEKALAAAGAVFWSKGYNGASLDDLAQAMAMNRPSIYRAFGDKQAVYRKSLAMFIALMKAGFKDTVAANPDVHAGLKAFYRDALKIYTGSHARGCMLMCTAPAAVDGQPAVQEDLRGTIEQIDLQLERRFTQAVEDGQIAAGTDAATLARLAQSVLHSLAIRARAGESAASLSEFSDNAVDILLG